MMKKSESDAPVSREMTPDELAADVSHKAAHAKAIAEETALAAKALADAQALELASKRAHVATQDDESTLSVKPTRR